MFGHSTYYTHNGDADLARQLGLRQTTFGREWTNLGEVQCAAGKVMVEVVAYPAQFFRFTFTPNRDSEAAPVVLQTGSGGLGDYWPIAEKFGNGMLEVER